MARILFLLLIGIFVSSVLFWAEDQFLDGKLLQDKIQENIEDDGIENVETEKIIAEKYTYGMFKSGAEVMVYDSLSLSDLENYLDQGYDLLVLLDGKELDQSRYNFMDVRLVKITDFDGDFYYTLKYGMEVKGGYVFSKRDFQRVYENMNENSVVFKL